MTARYINNSILVKKEKIQFSEALFLHPTTIIISFKHIYYRLIFVLSFSIAISISNILNCFFFLSENWFNNSNFIHVKFFGLIRFILFVGTIVLVFGFLLVLMNYINRVLKLCTCIPFRSFYFENTVCKKKRGREK